MRHQRRRARRARKSLLLLLLLGIASLVLGSCSPGSAGGSGGNTNSAAGSINFSQLNMIDANTGWATTSESVLKTGDGGKTWTDVTPTDWEPLTSTTSADNPAIQGIISAAFLDANHGWIVAPTPIPQDAIDAQQTVAAQATVQDDGTVTLGTNKLPSVKTQVYVRSTIDGGTNWVTSNALDADNLVGTSRPDFINVHEGWLELIEQNSQNAEAEGVVYHTVDGGINWTPSQTGTGTSPSGSGSLNCQICSVSGLVTSDTGDNKVVAQNQLTGLAITQDCGSQGNSSQAGCSSTPPTSSGALGCTVTGTQNYVGWATGIMAKSSGVFLSRQVGEGAQWSDVNGIMVPGGAPLQGSDSAMITEPPVVFPNGDGGGILPIEIQSDPNGDDPSHFFVHLYQLQLQATDGSYTLSDLSPTSPFAGSLNMGAHTLSAPDAAHVFVVGQSYTNGTYGNWGLYQFDGKNWNTLNSQTDATIPAPANGEQPNFFDTTLGNLDFISPTEGWATNGTSLYHITIANGVATWSQVYPGASSANGDTSPTRTPGTVIAAPQNPGSCSNQTKLRQNNVPPPGNSNSQLHTLTFANSTNQTIWVGGSGTAIDPGSWNGELTPGSSKSLAVKTPSSNLWSGRFWGRTGCDANGSNCATGDCGAPGLCDGKSGALPASLAEFAFNADQGQIFYDVSLVDGYNLPLLIHSSGGASPDNCGSKACVDLNASCPSALQVKNAGGNVVACDSACTAFGAPQYCCTGSYVSGVCNPNTWPADVNSAKLFKDAYPHAYSYAYDDATSTYTCAETCNFTITFGLSTT